ncbi:hypothetical protein QTL95_21200 [Rhizobium sp. S152]|uniref:hypothetical protein n=1 Tax=Rhizobium sp. S152 TaxID=3055038 RepID=UPI0025A94495|nr:hypothetical protein [Rhizobium sp. S152]MDM9628418.1 hypothetical protein [Rhizobium sp. S152]
MKAEEQQGSRDCDVSCEEARAELERLFSDERFHATERSRAILRYIAERHFDGCADGVKAYSIALDVLGRQSNFDPSLDPIVRIELSRLRSSLNQYYEAFGADDGISIELPRGRYVAVFLRGRDNRRRSPESSAAPALREIRPQSTDEAATQPHAGVSKWRLALERWKVRGGVLALIAVGFAGGAALYGARPVTTAKPTVTITMTVADKGLGNEADRTRDLLLTALTQFQTLTISQSAARGRPLSAVLRPAISRAYDIDMKYYGDDDDRTVWWQIVDANAGDVLKSGIERVDTNGRSISAVQAELVTQLSRRFAATRSVINMIEAHDYAEGTLGNACVLKADYELDSGGADGIGEAVDCLEATLARDPHDADAAAALASLMARGRDGSATGENLDRALQLANRAASLAPLSDRASTAVMLAQFHSGRMEAAIKAGNRALSLNPNNPDVMAKLGMVLFAAGYFAAGASLAEDAGRAVDVVPRDAAVVLVLDAYRRGDWSTASLLAEQVSDSDFVIWSVRTASLGQLGSSLADARLAAFRKIDPGFEASFYERMSAYRLGPDLAASIEQGLRKAGADVKAKRLAAAL